MLAVAQPTVKCGMPRRCSEGALLNQELTKGFGQCRGSAKSEGETAPKLEAAKQIGGCSRSAWAAPQRC